MIVFNIESTALLLRCSLHEESGLVWGHGKKAVPADWVMNSSLLLLLWNSPRDSELQSAALNLGPFN